MKLFRKAEGGNFAITTALLCPMLIGGVGFAVDYSSLVSARSKLQNSVDAAVLAAGQELKTQEQRTQIYNLMLEGDVDTSMKIASRDLKVEDGLNYIEITGTATADVDLLILGHVGKSSVSARATAYQSTENLAISLVLDNTGSMGQAGIDALKKASHALVNAVEHNASRRKDILLSVVPFVTAVNIKGEGFDESWIDKDGKALYNGWNFLNPELRERRKKGERLFRLPDAYADEINGKGEACDNVGVGAAAIEKRELCDRLEAAKVYPHQMKLFELTGTTWKGCVEARPGPYNLDTTTPSASKPDTLFVPYFAPDEPSPATWAGGNDSKGYNNSWLDDRVTGTGDLVQRSTLKYVNPDVKLVEEGKALSRGPNRACPTPVTPLTTDLKKVRAGIDAMRYWNGSGTNIAEGLAWGWRVVSGNAPYPKDPSLSSGSVAKYIVLMTDGRNVSYGASGTPNKSDYGSYGFLASSRIGNTNNQGKAETTLNDWTLQMCTDIKKQGIEIFTVVYNETADSVHKMFKSCATRPTNFHMANNTAALEAAFARIGSDISVLRLTQ